MAEEAEVSVATYLKGLLSCSDPVSDVMSNEPAGNGVEILNRFVFAFELELLEPLELVAVVPTLLLIFFPSCSGALEIWRTQPKPYDHVLPDITQDHFGP